MRLNESSLIMKQQMEQSQIKIAELIEEQRKIIEAPK